MFVVARTLKTTVGTTDHFHDHYVVVGTRAQAEEQYRLWRDIPTLHNLVMGPISASIDDHLYNLPATLKQEIAQCP